MRSKRKPFVASLFLLAGLASATGAQVYVQSSHPDYPRVLYPDSLVSANDRCIVAREKLNRRVRPVYVNGTPIGFC